MNDDRNDDDAAVGIPVAADDGELQPPGRTRGVELRYALSYYLAQHGACTITDMVAALTHQGFHLGPNPPKAVSDALRWEIGRGRVTRVRRGTYDATTTWPRTTTHRIRKRVLAMRGSNRRGGSDGEPAMTKAEFEAYLDRIAREAQQARLGL